MSTSGLYGQTTNVGGTYFAWSVFQQTGSIPTTPIGGSWNFTTNTGVAPSTWSIAPPNVTATTTWVSIAIVDSRNPTTFTWSAPVVWANAGAGYGTVTNVGVVSSNGFGGSVASPSATPNITLSTTVTGILKGAAGALVAATPGTDYPALTTAASEITIASANQIVFTLAYTPITNGLVQVFINGMRLSATTDYTIVSTTLTLLTGATLNDEILVDYIHI